MIEFRLSGFLLEGPRRYSQASREKVKLVGRVGGEMGPTRRHRANRGELPPVVDVHTHMGTLIRAHSYGHTHTGTLMQAG